MKPLVSIILPTYNREDYLCRSIASVLNQTFDNFELVIVDDASTDNSAATIATFNDQRIVYLKHEQNRGGSAARNTGIKAARGELIAFQDSDDEWLPEKLAKQMAALADAPAAVGVVYTGFMRFSGDKKEYIPGPTVQVKDGDIHLELLKQNFVTTQAVLVKKECFQMAGMFDETFPRFQDWELFLRISKYFEFRYVPEPLVHSYFTEGSISSKPAALIVAVEQIIKNNLPELKIHPTIYSGQLLGLSNLYRYAGDIKKSRHFLRMATKVHYRPGLFVALFASFFGLSCFNAYWNLVEKLWGSK